MADSGATPGVDAPAPGEQGERALHVALMHLAVMPHSAFSCSADAEADALKEHDGVSEPLLRLRRCAAAGGAQARALARLATASRAFRDAAEPALPAPLRDARLKKTLELWAILATADSADILQCQNVQRAVEGLCDASSADDEHCAELAHASREALRSLRFREMETAIEQWAWLQAPPGAVADATVELRRWRSECFVAALEGTWDAHES
jgi:hypothetical protein